MPVGYRESGNVLRPIARITGVVDFTRMPGIRELRSLRRSRLRVVVSPQTSSSTKKRRRCWMSRVVFDRVARDQQDADLAPRDTMDGRTARMMVFESSTKAAAQAAFSISPRLRGRRERWAAR